MPCFGKILFYAQETRPCSLGFPLSSMGYRRQVSSHPLGWELMNCWAVLILIFSSMKEILLPMNSFLHYDALRYLEVRDERCSLRLSSGTYHGEFASRKSFHVQVCFGNHLDSISAPDSPVLFSKIKREHHRTFFGNQGTSTSVAEPLRSTTGLELPGLRCHSEALPHRLK